MALPNNFILSLSLVFCGGLFMGVGILGFIADRKRPTPEE